MSHPASMSTTGVHMISHAQKPTSLHYGHAGERCPNTNGFGQGGLEGELR